MIQSKLDKMSELFNKFCKVKCVVKDGIVAMEQVWDTPDAGKAFMGFNKAVQDEMKPKPVPKKKKTAKKLSKK